MNKKIIKQLANILFVILLFILMIVIVSNSTKELNIEDLKEFLKSSDKKYLIIAFGFSILYILFEAISLFVILRKLGYKVKARNAIAYSTSDVYYSAITPSASGGQPASAFYMIRDGVDAGTASFSLVFNLIGYTSAIIIMGLVSLVFGFEHFINLAHLLNSATKSASTTYLALPSEYPLQDSQQLRLQLKTAGIKQKPSNIKGFRALNC